MKYEIALSNTYVVKDRLFPMGSIILYLDNNTILVGSNFAKPRKYKMELFVYIPTEKKWVKTYAKNEYTEIMWKCHRKHQKKHRTHQNYTQMMKHERRHKNGGGGSLIGNSSMITDYECSKNPLHDFYRSMYVQWN